MTRQKAKILVATHKPGMVYQDDVFMPIQVGMSNAKFDLGYQGDNTGDNISLKNPSYCELTALYWAWKNLKDVDYIGLCHYRRYFDFHKQVPQYAPVYYEPCASLKEFKFSISDKALGILHKGGVIVPKKLLERQSLIIKYCLSHVSDDLRTLYQVIDGQQEEKYISAFKKVMYGNHYSPFNMFVMPWATFCDYCEWLFSVLYQVETHTDISHYNPVQRRIYGYMAERLLNIYLTANQLQQYELPVITFDDDKVNMNKTHLRRFAENAIKRASFAMSLPPVLED